MSDIDRNARITYVATAERHIWKKDYVAVQVSGNFTSFVPKDGKGWAPKTEQFQLQDPDNWI